MKTYTIAVLVLCMVLMMPHGSDAFAAGTGKFGDEMKVYIYVYSYTLGFYLSIVILMYVIN